MRLELAGSLIQPEPLVINFESNQTFSPQDYIDLGYSHFEVICIGGGGGSGGGIDTNNTGTFIRSYGGAGGGGGFQRVRGLLSALPTTCPVVIGNGGTGGSIQSSNPALTTDGIDGEFSTFNTSTCRASGGKGGKRVQTNSVTAATLAHGGDGGVGNRTIAGGGAAGGLAGTPTSTGPGTAGVDGQDGTLFNNIGKGGGGGAGGVGKYGGITCNAATAGGRGSYNPGDTSVYGPGEGPVMDGAGVAALIRPGRASGAKGAPLNGLPTVYGRSGVSGSGAPGMVLIRLTADVVVVNAPVVEPPPEETPTTFYGASSLAMTFYKAVSSQSTPGPLPNLAYGSSDYGYGAYGTSALAGQVNVPIIFSKDVKAKIKTYGQIASPFTFGKSVVGDGLTPPRQTPTAEISLASHATPSVRTNHAIKIRARIVSSSGGLLKVSLYEGATNRSGILTSDTVTTSYQDFVLLIDPSNAAAITSYANLSIRFFGYDFNGHGLVFQVVRVVLELPA